MNKNFLTHVTASLLSAVLLFLVITETNPVYSQSGDTVLAVVNGREIKQHEVDAVVIPQVMALEQQLYAIRKATLENLILTSLLEAEARKRSVSLEELRKILTSTRVAVTSAEVDSEYEENITAFGAMSPDEAKERLRLDLESRARMRTYREAIKQLRQEAKVELLIKEPSLPLAVATDASPSLGPKNAAITIVEFADFQCPYCRESQEVIKQILKTYGTEVKLVFRHLPLEIHPEAFTGARAAFCAGEQGAFWQYHDALFASPTLSASVLQKVASASQLNLTKFSECLNSDASRLAVMRDKRDAARLGISSTPTFVVNGKLIHGAIDFETFKTLIERERKSARSTSPL